MIKKNYKDLIGKLPIFILLILAFSAIAVLYLKKTNFLQFGNDYYSIFYNTSPEVNENINISGIKVGYIKEKELVENNFIKVKIFIDKEYIDKIKKDSVLVYIKGISGFGKELTIYPGYTSEDILQNGDLIFSSESRHGKVLKENYEKKYDIIYSDIVKDSFTILEKLADKENGITTDLGAVYQNITKINESLKNGALSKIKDENVKKQIETFVNELNNYTLELEKQSKDVSILLMTSGINSQNIYNFTSEGIKATHDTVILFNSMRKAMPQMYLLINSMNKTSETILYILENFR